MVESQPSKLLVAGSIPVSRSKTDLVLMQALCTARGLGRLGSLAGSVAKFFFFTRGVIQYRPGTVATICKGGLTWVTSTSSSSH